MSIVLILIKPNSMICFNENNRIYSSLVEMQDYYQKIAFFFACDFFFSLSSSLHASEKQTTNIDQCLKVAGVLCLLRYLVLGTAFSQSVAFHLILPGTNLLLLLFNLQSHLTPQDARWCKQLCPHSSATNGSNGYCHLMVTSSSTEGIRTHCTSTAGSCSA